MSASVRKTHVLVRLALLLCPREFRKQYGEQICEDARHFGTLHAVFDGISAGLALHGENFGRNLRLAAKSLLKAPLFTLVAVGSIAIGIGANVAVAGAIEGVVIRPLPYADASRLMVLTETTELGTSGPSYPDARDIMSATKTLSGVASSGETDMLVLFKSRAIKLLGRTVAGNYFAVLGVRPEIGRFLRSADMGRRNVVISDGMWRRYYGSRSDVIGKSLVLRQPDGLVPYTVVGVAQPSLRDPSGHGLRIETTDFWIPSPNFRNRGHFGDIGLARLAPGVSFSQAQSDLARVGEAIARKYPRQHHGYQGMRLVPVMSSILGSASEVFWALYAAVGALLLIACANVANLQLARAASREADFVLRSALGASRARLVKELVFEAALISLGGGILAIGIAASILSALSPYAMYLVPRWEHIGIDWHLLAYAGALIAAATFLTGLLPALAASHGDLSRALKPAGANDRQPPTQPLALVARDCRGRVGALRRHLRRALTSQLPNVDA